MSTTKEKWQEIANRGLQDRFEPERRERFDEAVRRGLITLPNREKLAENRIRREIKRGSDLGLVKPDMRLVEEQHTREERESIFARNLRDLETNQSATDKRDVENLSLRDVPSRGGPIVKGFRDAGQSLLQGATLGFSDEIQSVLSAAMASPFISDSTFNELRKDALRSIRADQAQFAEENPVSNVALQLVGGVATGGAAGIARVGAKEIAKRGALLGGTAGVGFSDADEGDVRANLSENIEDALVGATGGAVLSVLTPAVIKKIASVPRLISQNIPEKLLETVLKIRPSISRVDRDKMVRTSLDQGIMPSIVGLRKMAEKITTLDRGINSLIDDATAAGKTIPRSKLFSNIAQLRKDFAGIKINGSRDRRIINRVLKSLLDQLKASKQTNLTPRQVQDLKTNAYKTIEFDLRKGTATKAGNETRKALARSAKESLEELDPNIKRTNRELGNLIDLQKELDNTVSRLGNRNIISLDTAAKIGAGAAGGLGIGATTGSGTAGLVGTAIGGGAAVLGSPRIKARIAFALENMRKTAEIRKGAALQLSPEAASVIAILVGNKQDSIKDAIFIDEGPSPIQQNGNGNKVSVDF